MWVANLISSGQRLCFIYFQSFKLLRDSLWLSKWSVLENISCVLKKSVHSADNKLFDSIILVISVHADFFVVFLSVFVSRLLKSLSIIIKLSVSSFNSARFYFMYFGALLLSIYVLGLPWWFRWVKNPPAMQETRV